MEGSLKFEDGIYSRNYKKMCLGMCSEHNLKNEDGQGLGRVLARPLSGHLRSLMHHNTNVYRSQAGIITG